MTTKPDDTPVTSADEAVNDDFIRRVARRFPDDAVLGEEASRPVDGARTWVIDPIDGTQQFVLGLPLYMVSVALVVDGDPVLGVTANPSTGEVYWAETGRGAFRDGVRLRVSTRDGTAEPAVVVGARRHRTSADLDADSVLRVTFDGPPVVEVPRYPYPSVFTGCKIAEGTWDGDLYDFDGAHDVAAVCVLVREAGGRVTDRHGGDQRYDRPVDGCVLSNGHVHDALLRHWDG